ncbi:MAG: chemotaxis protein CheX [Sulfuricurvum sp.]|uniref:chemotaxis protein CheX n=2 Tax=Sulfuricurvum sp. TaxID=2025608 RepID=UPI00260375A2|nr:chemotaxis protein CheX [Sulfuricurvum sp.]MDD2828960.1 chemotaxis protein CheX [Sulfuricurvum sp.]
MMLTYILKAAENFCIHQIRLPHQIITEFPKKRTLLAYLDIEAHDGEKYRTYIGCDETLLLCISEIFLGQEITDTETLRDMLLETTNMIVGSAKVLCEEDNCNTFNISTPHLLDSDSLDMPFDKYNTIHIADGEIFMALKAL